MKRRKRIEKNRQKKRERERRRKNKWRKMLGYRRK